MGSADSDGTDIVKKEMFPSRKTSSSLTILPLCRKSSNRQNPVPKKIHIWIPFNGVRGFGWYGHCKEGDVSIKKNKFLFNHSTSLSKIVKPTKSCSKKNPHLDSVQWGPRIRMVRTL